MATGEASRKLFDLSGRVAVVTGGNRGLGKAIALALADAGAAVAIMARDEAKNAETTFIVAGFSFAGAGQNSGIAFVHSTIRERFAAEKMST